jgi:hypothetical protein
MDRTSAQRQVNLSLLRAQEIFEIPASGYYSIVVKEITHLTGREVENRATSCRFGTDPPINTLVSVCVSADSVGRGVGGGEELP